MPIGPIFYKYVPFAQKWDFLSKFAKKFYEIFKCHDLSRIRRWSEGGKQDLHFGKFGHVGHFSVWPPRVYQSGWNLRFFKISRNFCAWNLSFLKLIFSRKDTFREMNLGETGQHLFGHFFTFDSSDSSPEKNTVLYCKGLGWYFFG